MMMKSWVIKSRSPEDELSKAIAIGNKEPWPTMRPPKDWSIGDHLFIWAGSPTLRVVGLGILDNIRSKRSKRDETWFDVAYTTNYFRRSPRIKELRKDPILGKTSFLKQGPAGTVFPLTDKQADKLLQVISKFDPDIQLSWKVGIEEHVQPPSVKPPIAPPSTQGCLRVFLCHSSADKDAVRVLYRQLKADGIKPWLDEEDLLPGQDWKREISKEVCASDIVIVCLSKDSVTKKGFVQKEIKFALDRADEQPEGAIFIIPLKLESCAVPDRLTQFHWVDYFKEHGYGRLMEALKKQASEMKAKQ
jgi:hypothetical protein